MTLQQLQKKALRMIINKILSKRSCRSHEPENCNICEERKKIIDLFDKDFIDSLITKAYEECVKSKLNEKDIEKLKALAEIIREDDLLDLDAYNSISRADKIDQAWKSLKVIDSL